MVESAGPAIESEVPVLLVEFQLTHKDDAALHWINRRNPKLRPPLVFGLGLLISGGIGLGVSAGGRGTPYAIFIGVLGLVIVLLVAISPFTGLKKYWETNPAHSHPKSIRFSEDKLQITSGTTTFRRQAIPEVWQSAFEIRTDYLLMMAGQKGRYTIVPKRAFSSKEDEKVFRDLVGQRIPAHFRSL